MLRSEPGSVKLLILIPARGGSKGLPGKNLLPVGGISLVGRAARTGRRFLARSGAKGLVFIDTDDPRIAQEAVRWGAEAPFLRPTSLAADGTPMIENVVHALDRLAQGGRNFDVLILLQPTSPLREPGELQACFQALLDGHDSAITIVTPDHAPELTLRRAPNLAVSWAWPELAPQGRRQELPEAWRPAGSVYAWRVEALRRGRRFMESERTIGIAVPPERGIDVDTQADLERARALAAAAPLRPWAFEGRAIGPGQPSLLIAEAGVNHNGDGKLAHRLVDAAADAGADVVKFQTFDPARLVSPRAAMADYQARNTGTVRTQAEMLGDLVLPRTAHGELMAHARERGLKFLSSPFDLDSARFLCDLGLGALKLGSGELTHHALLAGIARLGLPMIVSTGMAEMVEVDRALDVIEQNGDPPVALLHCVTSYPAAPADCNLTAMATLQAAFQRPVGFSDHSEGLAVSLAAAALGAAVIEKHLTLDRNLPGPDHRASLEPKEWRELARGVRELEAARGDGLKAPRPVELPLRDLVRRSLFAARDLSAGARLADGDLVALRPGTGLSPERAWALLGRKLRRAVAQGQMLQQEDLA